MAEDAKKSKKRSKSVDNMNGKVKKSKKSKHSAVTEDATATTNAGSASLLADEQNIDNTLSSLFAKPTPRLAKRTSLPAVVEAPITEAADTVEASLVTEPISGTSKAIDEVPATTEETAPRRKRKRKDADDDLEDGYMRKLARQAEKEAVNEDNTRRIAELGVDKPVNGQADNSVAEEDDENEEDDEDDEAGQQDVVMQDEEDSDDEQPPQHESLTQASSELEKAGRTVFVGNVSTTAITTKSARRILEKHLVSFIKQEEDGKRSGKLESLRFRSTPYDPSLPKKAAFAKKEVVDATAQSTNAYAVYSTAALSREAVRRLNASVVLDRHIRVDSVAHPSPVDHKRCVFVGNLGFVDDETNIIAANEAEGREKRKQKQKPSDVEEGLWRLFSKHGTVESVRVVRDKGTRVGKGIAYVQFTDQNGVESALSEDGKKSPPMLPRSLRVSRAKAMKRKKPEQDRRARRDDKPSKTEYRRKITPGEATYRGRVGKLMGKAAAALATKPENFKSPESFVFEGHRASEKQRNSGLKLGKAKKKALPTKSSNKRASAYKAGKVIKKT